MKLTVDITGPQEAQLRAVAERLNVPAEALATAALRDLVSQRESDFEAAAARVLEKNADLYRRLA
jgi:hypothetical protein